MYGTIHATLSKNRIQMFTANMTDLTLFNNVVMPVKLQQSYLKPSIQPYLQLPSCLLHILLTHVRQWESQLTPYLPVVHSEEKKQRK